MLFRLNRYLKAPVFADDEEKNRAARILNALQLSLIGVTLLAGIATLFIFVEKLGSLMVVMGMAIVLTISRVLMYRGHLRMASILSLAGMWVVVTGLVVFAGGMRSIDAVYYLSLTIIGGLLLGTRVMITLAGLSALAGLATVLSEEMGHPLPQLFPVPAIAGWINFSFSMFLVVITVAIALDNLYGALALARQRLEERHKAEQERERMLLQVQEQARQIQQVMDTVPEGVLLLNEEGRVLSANRLGQRDLQTLAGINIGETLTQLADRPLGELLTSPPGGLWHEFELDNRHFQALARPIKSEHKSEGWVLVIRDVTRQRLMEQQSQQQDRLAAVGQLAAGIAHDFNNIMATIVLYSQMSLRVENVPQAVLERLKIIYQQAMHATHLTQQILDFSRRAVLDRYPFDLLVLIKEELKLLQRTLPENIQISLTYEHGDYTTNGSPTSLQQVLMNLAVNARDAMPNGGALHLDLKRIEVTEPEGKLLGLSAGSWIHLAVSDTGSGISPEVLPHIFEPFFTTKPPGKGTGLGLAQVYGIIEMHGGQIRTTTQVGKGTTFDLYLPALETIVPEPLTQNQAPRLVMGQNQAILVVEDNPVTRMALKDGLEALNYKVIAAENGHQALDILETRAAEISLILSDVLMPEMGGIELIRQIKKRALTIRTILLTGHPLKEELEDLQHDGLGPLLADWSLKPVDFETLGRIVAHALSK